MKPFNHTAHDVELDAEGVVDFGGVGNPGNWQPTDQIRNRVPQFFSPRRTLGAAARLV